jgi:glutaminase
MCFRGRPVNSTKPLNDAAVRAFLASFKPKHLHEIVHAVNEYTQAVATRMHCDDLATQRVLTNHDSLTAVRLLANLLYQQSLAWGDPVYAEYEDYVHSPNGLEVVR